MTKVAKENVSLKSPKSNNNTTFSDYANKGVIVIPEKNSIPQTSQGLLQWSKFYKSPYYKPTAEELLEWDLSSGYNMGLVTGEPSNIIILDCDYAQPEHILKIEQLLGNTPVKKYGSKGLSFFYRYNGERNEVWKKDNVILAELLSTGRKSTIPPSIHQKTKQSYQWTGTHDLITGLSLLPALPSNYSETLDSLFSITRESYIPAPSSYTHTKPTYSEAVTALNYCDPNCTNEEWVNIGMAFRAEVGDAGFSDFDAWSSKGKSYDKHTMRSRWRSFTSHSITYGTLIHYAKHGGYVPPQIERPVIKATDINSWEKRKLEIKAEAIQQSSQLPQFYTNAPEHIKTITNWILSTSLYPHPIITLGSVLAFLGFVMGRDFQFNSLRSNLYIANIAYSADGKEHINRCIRGLMHKTGLDKHLAHGWSADTAIVERLSKNEGKVFYLTDELQAALKSIANKNTGSRESAATEKLLQAYTGIEVSTIDYANSKERPTISVKNPFITICGYTTPPIFEQCLGSTEVFSGFVGRLSVFRGNKLIPEENENFQGNAWEKVPQEVVEVMESIKRNRQREQRPDGSFMYAQKEIPTQHLGLIKQYRERIRQKRNEMRLEGDSLEAIFGRAAEQMIKYAIIASQGQEILEEHIHWAISVVEYNIGIICEVAENFADNNFERKKIKALQFIQKRGGMIEKSAFTKGCAIFDNGRERDEVIKDLIEGGRLEKIDIEGPTKSKTGYRVVSELQQGE